MVVSATSIGMSTMPDCDGCDDEPCSPASCALCPLLLPCSPVLPSSERALARATAGERGRALIERPPIPPPRLRLHA